VNKGDKKASEASYAKLAYCLIY